MEGKTILILGGYGAAGLATARLLRKETDVRLVLAGRSREKAEKAASQLNVEFPSDRVSWHQVDASDSKSLTSALKDADMVLDCATTTQYTEQIASAALSAGIDYMDIHYPQKIVPVLNALAPSIKDAGRCFITQAGFHPGLPSAFVRLAASHFTHLRKALIGMVMSMRYIGSRDSVLELIEDISDYKAYVFENGHWRVAGYKDVRKINFGQEFGLRPCYPIGLEEMRALPEQYQLEETGVYVAGFNWFVDYIVFPLGIVVGKIRKGLGSRLLGRLLLWGVNSFSKPPFGVVFKLEAEGSKNGHYQSMEIVAQHEDGYLFTAIPTVACLLQYLDGSIARPGLWMMGQAVNPVRLLKDMERMGIKVQISIAD